MNAENSPSAVLFRPHRGGLDEAMAETREVHCLEDLLELLNGDPYLTPATLSNTRIDSYGFDARIGWHTYIVTVGGIPRGFTSGPLK